MMCLAQNKQTLYYALYDSSTNITDSDGYKTGEESIVYGTPTAIEMNISAAKGTVDVQEFGVDLDYTKTLVTDDINCPIDETSVLWIGIDPLTEPYNYTVVRVGKSLNSITYAVKEVTVTEIAVNG